MALKIEVLTEIKPGSLKLTIGRVIEEILTVETPRKRLGTQEMHKRYLGELFDEIGHLPLVKFTRLQYFVWMKDFKARKKEQRSTFNDYTKFINIISNYAYQQKYTTHLIKFPMTDPESERSGRVYTNAELKSLWLCMDESLKLQFVLSLECYMRLREVLHLTWDRVDLDNKKIILRKQDVKTGSKCGKGRVVPLSENAFRYLSEMNKHATTKWVFPNPQKTSYMNENRFMWRKCKAAARIKGRARWHDLRHTALSIAVMEKNVPLPHLSRVAGLSIRTLERVYLHSEVEQLRDVTSAINILKIA